MFKVGDRVRVRGIDCPIRYEGQLGDIVYIAETVADVRLSDYSINTMHLDWLEPATEETITPAMDANEYQRLAAVTANKALNQDLALTVAALGLTGEAGEIAELVKKGIYHGHGLDVDKLANELGDLQWYIAEACSRAGLSLASVMERNVAKLRKRYPEGFSTIDSIKRVDVGS